MSMRLLQRSTRKVTLTADGEEVLEHAREVLQASRALENISHRRGEIAGDIRLSAPIFFGLRRLVAPLAGFARQYPSARIDLQLCDDNIDLIGSRIDLAICIARRLPQSVIARSLGEIAMAVYGAPDYMRRKGTIQHPSELKAHDCLTWTSLSADGIEWAFTSTDLDQADAFRFRPAGRLNSNSQEALLSAAVSGLGLAMLPTILAEQAVANGELVPVLEAWTVVPMGVHLVYSSRHHLPQRLRVLIEHLSEHLGTNSRASAARDVDGVSELPARDRSRLAVRPFTGAETVGRRGPANVLGLRLGRAVGQTRDGAEAIKA